MLKVPSACSANSLQALLLRHLRSRPNSATMQQSLLPNGTEPAYRPRALRQRQSKPKLGQSRYLVCEVGMGVGYRLSGAEHLDNSLQEVWDAIRFNSPIAWRLGRVAHAPGGGRMSVFQEPEEYLIDRPLDADRVHRWIEVCSLHGDNHSLRMSRNSSSERHISSQAPMACGIALPCA